MNDVRGEKLAKLSWEDPNTGALQKFILVEGMEITLGRSEDNDISIPDRRVSRRHASVTYAYGLFLVADLQSANGVFVNEQKINEPFPLLDGDIIRLYVPTLTYSALSASDLADESLADVSTGHSFATTQPVLLVTSGDQKGTEIALYKEVLTFGRATSNATWDIRLRDHAVSRPHAKIELIDRKWYLTDLGSVNGTLINGAPVLMPTILSNGDVIVMGETNLVFQLNS